MTNRASFSPGIWKPLRSSAFRAQASVFPTGVALRVMSDASVFAAARARAA